MTESEESRPEIWGDESGNLDFDPRTGTKFFFVSTVRIADPNLMADLLDLRRRLDRRGFDRLGRIPRSRERPGRPGRGLRPSTAP